MDDEAKQLLRELRDIALRNEKRDSAWMEELREQYRVANEKSLRFARQSQVVTCTLLLILTVVSALSLFRLH